MIFKFLKNAECIIQKISQKRYFSKSIKPQVAVPDGPSKKPGKYLNEIVTQLEAFAPLQYAEKWDNVGLLVDPMEYAPIKNILLTNDLTQNVVNEAIHLRVGLVITYHPNINRSLTSISSRSWRERVLIDCLKNGIAVYSPHTSWDCALGGINDFLISCFQPEHNTITPIIPHDLNHASGIGRYFQLLTPLSVNGVIDALKRNTDAKTLRVALGRGRNDVSTVRSIALTTGYGGEILTGTDADVYISGEMLYPDILDATQNGITVIMYNYCDAERGFLVAFRDALDKRLDNTASIYVSQNDKDPLKLL